MLRFAVIGTNTITDNLITAAREHTDFALTAVYSRTVERGQLFADKHNIPHVFADWASFAGSGKFDAVYIASPNTAHAAQAISLMEHGKHVLCEKPIASNARQLQAMIDAAKANGVLLMEAMKSTPMPNFAAMREGLQRIGAVRRMTANYCQYSSRYDAFRQGTVLNAFNPALSNGSLMDLGVYCLYPAAVLFGKPASIKASGVMLSSGVDGAGSVLLGYEGMEAVITYSKITNSSAHSEIQGEDGTLVIQQISRPDKVELIHRDGTVEDLSRPQPYPPMYYETAHFIELVQQRKLESPLNSYTHSLLTMDIMDEARRQIGLVYPDDL